ncbi:TRAP transporter small permease [Microvirga massiliensis]|uniref:TRAP transporter small permease n=1 Tax=Microvirga massiliensis TaxID=1033741 RepID=UPI00062BBD20|nr:TRAP transporter small permease [Microvirga massiliensis]
MRRIVHALGGAANGGSRVGILLAELGLLSLMVLTAYSVVARYVFERPSMHAFEVSGYLLVAITWTAAGWVFKIDRHVSMEAVSHRLGGRWKMISDVIAQASVLVFCLVLVWVGALSTVEALQRDYRSASLLRFPLWTVYAFIPIGAGVLGLAALRRLVQTICSAVDGTGVRQ